MVGGVEIDLGIIVPTLDEWKYFRDHWKGRLAPELMGNTADTSSTDSTLRFEYTRANGEPKYTCVAVSGEKADSETARKLAVDLIREYSPKAIIILGFAGRINPEYSLGDVILPDFISSTDSGGKVTDSETQTKKNDRPISMIGSRFAKEFNTAPEFESDRQKFVSSALGNRKKVLEILKEATSSGKPTQITETFIFPKIPQLQCAPIFHSSKTIDSPKFIEALLNMNRRHAAIESESYPIVEQASLLNYTGDIVTIRGLSDDASMKGALDQITGGAIRDIAMKNVLDVFDILLDFGILSEQPEANSKASVRTSSNLTSRSIEELESFIMGGLAQGREKVDGIDSAEFEALSNHESMNPNFRKMLEDFILKLHGRDDVLAKTALDREEKIRNQMLGVQNDTLKGLNVDRQRNSILDIRGALSIYMASAILTTPSIYNAFTSVSFKAKDWTSKILKAQVLGLHENHIHYSNDKISGLIAEDLYSTPEHSQTNNKPILKRFMEIGTGGCNTTFRVLDGVLGSPLAEKHNLTCEYLGVDINPRFVSAGNALFDGVRWAGLDELHDPRIKLKKFVDKNRLRSWKVADHVFIKKGDASNYITRMYQNYISAKEKSLKPHANPKESDRPENYKIDYFFASYVFHHVLNGEALLRFLFAPHSELHRSFLLEKDNYDINIDLLCFNLRENLLAKNTINDIDDIIERQTDNTIQNQSILAEGLAQYLNITSPHLTGQQIDKLIADLRKFLTLNSRKQKNSDERFIDSLNKISLPAYLEEFFKDQQRTMLEQVFQMMNPGGKIYIADPDGMSKFNRNHIVEQDAMGLEMILSNFRNSTQMQTILEDCGFEVTDCYITAKVRDTSGTYELHEAKPMRHELLDFEDENLGYIVVGKKPKIKT